MSGAPLRLLHVFPSFEVGGAQVRTVQLANLFGPRYRHVVLAMDGNEAAGARFAPGIDVAFLRMAIDRRETMHNFVRFRRAIAETAPDVLVTYNWGAIDWAAANHPRLARHIHVEDGFGADEARGPKLRRVLFRRLVLRGTQAVVLPSRGLAAMARDLWRVPPARIAYVPNGIAIDRFAGPPDADLVAAFGLGAGPVVGTVAGLRPEKNVGRLIDAFALVRRRHAAARLVVVGQGVERAALEARAAALGLGGSVVFTGALERPERLIGRFDVFALSSDTEQMPYSVIEAMAAGRPVAATDVGDVGAMVAPENSGHMVPRDSAALAGAIVRLLDDPAAARAIGAANAAKARAEFDERVMAERYAALFDGRAP
jgi:glycosyltransferase involved in cell wall biosynthesis